MLLPLTTAAPAAASELQIGLRLSSNKISLRTGAGGKRLTAVVRVARQPHQPNVPVILEFQVPLGEHGVQISEGTPGCQAQQTQMRCSVPADRAEHRYSIRIAPPGSEGPEPGESVKGNGAVLVREPADGAGPPRKSTPYRVVLASPETSVREVSGKVVSRDDDEPVPGAAVTVQDSDRKKWDTTTDADGRFRIKNTSGKPLSPGTFTITVSKKGYRPYEVRLREGAGESIKGLQMILIPVPKQGKPAAKESEPEDGGGWLPWAVGLFGALLAVGGAVAALVLWRRGQLGGPSPDEARPGFPEHSPSPAREAHATGRLDHPTTAVGADRLSHPTTVVGRRDGAQRDRPAGQVNPRAPVGDPADDDLGALVRRSLDEADRGSGSAHWGQRRGRHAAADDTF